MPMGLEKPVWIRTSWMNGGASFEEPGSTIVWSSPAFTRGGSFARRTVTVSESETVNIPSVPVSVRTYVPATVNVAVVNTEAGSANPTDAGPLAVHAVV